METNTTAHKEDLVFTEIPFPKRKAAYEKPAVVINSSKGKRDTGGMYALESQFDQHMPIKTKTLIAGRDIVSDSMSVFYTLFYFPLTK